MSHACYSPYEHVFQRRSRCTTDLGADTTLVWYLTLYECIAILTPAQGDFVTTMDYCLPAFIKFFAVPSSIKISRNEMRGESCYFSCAPSVITFQRIQHYQRQSTGDGRWPGWNISWVPYMSFFLVGGCIITFPDIVNSSQIRCILLLTMALQKWIHCPSTSWPFPDPTGGQTTYPFIIYLGNPDKSSAAMVSIASSLSRY